MAEPTQQQLVAAGGFSAGGVPGASYDTKKFALPDGVFKMNNQLYQQSGNSIAPINPAEAQARFTGGGYSIDQILAQAPETTTADLQKLGLGGPTSTDAQNAPNTQTYLTSMQQDAQLAQKRAISTAQPSPTTVQAQPFTGGAGGVQGSTTPSPYQIGAKNATSAGVQAPGSTAEGLSMVQNYANPTRSNPQADVILQRDQAYQQYLNDFTLSQNSLNQGASLSQMYQTFAQQMGIPALDTKMMNLQAIIDGNEDALRSEIQSAGGTATAQQIQAMANSRNKQNIANYNNLVNQRNNMQQNLTTMIGLAEKDRAYAAQQIDRQLNFDQQRIEYADKMVRNAQETFDRNLQAIGWTGILQATQNDPSEISVIEKLYGMQPGGLQIAAQREAQSAAQAEQDRQLELQGKLLTNQLRQAQIGTEKLQQQKIINDLKPVGVTGTAVTSQPITQNSLDDLLLQYRSAISGSNAITRVFGSSTKQELESLRSQITAQYKQEKKLGTLDAGVQRLIEGIIGKEPGVLSILNPFSKEGESALLAGIDSFLKNESGIDLSTAGALRNQLQKKEILVINKQTRELGAIPESEFDSKLYSKI